MNDWSTEDNMKFFENIRISYTLHVLNFLCILLFQEAIFKKLTNKNEFHNN